MNHKEFMNIIEYIASAINKPIPPNTVAVYERELKDLDGKDVENGVRKLICSNIYPTLPTIGAIRNEVVNFKRLNQMSGAEALRMVNLAIEKHGSYGKKDAKEELPGSVWMMIEAMGGWIYVCQCTTPEVWQSNFLRTYDAQIKRQIERAVLPADLQVLVGALAESKSLNVKEGELTNGIR